MIRDLTFALRALRRAPAFAAIAVVTLALGIGGTTAVFSVVDAVVVHGLPYGDAGRLWTIYERSDDGQLRVPSFPTFQDWQSALADAHGVFDGLVFVRGDGLTIGKNPERQIAAYVAPGFFHLMGAGPMLGRTFTADEEQPGAERVAVLSYDSFVRQFGGDRSVIGTRVAIDSVPTTIVGVMPRGFAFPNFGSGGWLPPAVWQPIAVFQATHAALAQRGLHVDSRTIVRLRAGADSASAAAAMRTIERRLAAEYPNEQAHWTSVALRSLPNEMFGDLWSMLGLVSGAIGLVLLLACASVANLLLVRSSVRGPEFAIRAALGASRWQVAKPPFVEAAVLAFGGGLLGYAFATLLVSTARPFAAQRLPFAAYITMNATAGMFAIGITVATALLVGALPALQASHANLIGRLRGSTSSGRSSESRVRNALVAAQFALAITLLAGAGVLVQSVRRATAVPLGYEPGGLINFAIAPPAHRYQSPAEAAALYQRMLDAMRAMPSVSGVAAAGGALLPTKVVVEGRSGSSALPTASYHPVSSDYFRVLHVPIARGRGFTDEDMRSPTGLIVSDTLAKQLWPGENPIGQRITIYRQSQARADFGQPITMPVVGVAADYHEFGPENDAPPQVFLPFTLEVWPWMDFVVRTDRTVPGTLAEVEQAVRAVEPAVTFYGKPSFDRSGSMPSLADPRMFVTGLLGVFGAIALLLAATGLYGVVSYAVARRTREIGIRIAIGATSRAIVGLLLRSAMSVVFVGIAAGVLIALAATKLLHALLFQTAPTDVATFALVPVILALVAILASLAPALRATRTDPSLVMKAE